MFIVLLLCAYFQRTTLVKTRRCRKTVILVGHFLNIVRRFSFTIDILYALGLLGTSFD